MKYVQLLHSQVPIKDTLFPVRIILGVKVGIIMVVAEVYRIAATQTVAVVFVATGSVTRGTGVDSVGLLHRFGVFRDSLTKAFLGTVRCCCHPTIVSMERL
jgi:hypothetical protein